MTFPEHENCSPAGKVDATLTATLMTIEPWAGGVVGATSAEFWTMGLNDPVRGSRYPGIPRGAFPRIVSWLVLWLHAGNARATRQMVSKMVVRTFMDRSFWLEFRCPTGPKCYYI